MQLGTPLILDVCCGPRSMWVEQKNSQTVYLDKRNEDTHIKPDKHHPSGRVISIRPDICADFTALPLRDNTFCLVVYDPPHLTHTKTGILAKTYGFLSQGWESMLREGFNECFRVLKPSGVLIFKWATTDVPLKKVLKMSPYPPLFGHRSGKAAKTHWMTFMKLEEPLKVTRQERLPFVSEL